MPNADPTPFTANQVVAWNLALARTFRGLTQEEAAERLEPFLGERWSKVTFSAAERSVTGRRVRNFDADEIVAFARAFELPVAWFFVPPERDPWDALPTIKTPSGVPAERLITPEILADRVADMQRLEVRLDGAALNSVERERILFKLEDFSRDLYVWANQRQRDRLRAGDEEVRRALGRRAVEEKER
jgi:transcriptional regulator with XRE-family HTH domain